MEETFFCDCCREDIDINYINSHFIFCELIQELAAQEIEDLLSDMDL